VQSSVAKTMSTSYPSCLISSHTARPSAALMSVKARRAPLSASNNATARPIPEPQPLWVGRVSASSGGMGG
jgi:hypothetical protein